MFHKILQQLLQGPAREASPERFPAHARSKMLARTPNMGPSIFRGVWPIMLLGQIERFRALLIHLIHGDYNMATDRKRLDQPGFLARYRFSEEEFRGCGLNWENLEVICSAHAANLTELEASAKQIVDLLRQIPEVHSLKYRIKHPEHLVAKIIHKRIGGDNFDVTPTNYDAHITDLIGIRALHLFKDQWQGIHTFVKNTWDLAETPIAYIRKGDPEDIVSGFGDFGCDVKEHDFGYRSVHYLLKSQPTKQLHLAELQIRTLFEEAWSEIDHQIRYPRASDDSRLDQFLEMFNRLAGSADEMGSFVKRLSHSLQVEAEGVKEMQAQLQSKEADLKQAISALEIKESEKKALETKLEALMISSQPTGLVIGDPGFRYIGKMSYEPYLAGSITPPVWSPDLVTSGLPERTCSKCGQSFKDDSLLKVNERCPTCRTQL